MELEFEKRNCCYLDQILRDTRTEELVQEIRLGDGMPDVGRIIGAWGQMILRGKEWRGDCVAVSGGVMAWVLYAPEDGSEPRCLDAWLPFKVKWDLPEGVREGDIRVSCFLRMADGRNVSPRKIMTRAVVSIQVQVLCPAQEEIYMPPKKLDGVELLQRTYPMELYKEAGEKTFLVDEELELKNSGAKPERIFFSRLIPRIVEQKVLTNKMVFRGSGNLRVLGKGDDNRLHVWEFEIPFSQVAQLRSEYSPDARADLLVGITSLEPELDGEGRLRVKCGLLAQYLVNDRELISIVEDAYSPVKELEVRARELALPAVLEIQLKTIFAEQKLPMDGMQVVCCDFLPEHIRHRKTDTETILELPGIFQLLRYGENGELSASNVHWEQEMALPVDGDAWVEGEIQSPENVRITMGDGGVEMQAQIPMKMVTIARNEMTQVAGLNLGEEISKDPMRPTLILRRAGSDDLWRIAKDSGSTMDAIRRANDLTQEPDPDRMLLIPVS